MKSNWSDSCQITPQCVKSRQHSLFDQSISFITCFHPFSFSFKTVHCLCTHDAAAVQQSRVTLTASGQPSYNCLLLQRTSSTRTVQLFNRLLNSAKMWTGGRKILWNTNMNINRCVCCLPKIPKLANSSFAAEIYVQNIWSQDWWANVSFIQWLLTLLCALKALTDNQTWHSGIINSFIKKEQIK